MTNLIDRVAFAQPIGAEKSKHISIFGHTRLALHVANLLADMGLSS
jgi:hypothetical protein